MEGKVFTTLCALVLVALLASAESQQLSLRLCVVSYTSDAEHACIGGDVGLTDTSVLVQYRLDSEPSWIDVADINPKQGFNDTLHLHPRSSQLRLLQLEHGGGSCNCWSVEEASITRYNDTTQINCSTIQNPICGDRASSARGFRIIAFQGAQPTCSTTNLLISSKPSTLTQNCTAANIKM